MIFQMQEGYLTFAQGAWQDRSVHMLAADHLPVKGTNMVVTREVLPAGVCFDNYVGNQKSFLAKELSSFTLIGDKADSIDALPAHYLEFTWKNQGTSMHQIVMVLDNDRSILNLTATVPGTIDETTRDELYAVMKSFTPGSPPAGWKSTTK